MLAPVHWRAIARPPRPCTRRRSSAWIVRGFDRSSRVHTCSTASGCAARGAGSTPAPSSASPMSSSRRLAWKHSPSAPAASWWQRVRSYANAPSRPMKTSLHRRRRSHGLPARASQTPRSAGGSSSARTRVRSSTLLAPSRLRADGEAPRAPAGGCAPPRRQATRQSARGFGAPGGPIHNVESPHPGAAVGAASASS